MIYFQNCLAKIGYILQSYRFQNKLSQIEMADLLKLSYRQYQRIELSESMPKIETLIQIGYSLNFPISLFFENHDLKIFLLSDERNVWPHSSIASSFKVISKGDGVTFDKELAQATGVPSFNIKIDDYLLAGHSIERWEYLYRHQYKDAIIENFYLFPNGFKVFKEIHLDINPHPYSMTSNSFWIETTENHNLINFLIDSKFRNSLKS